MKKIEMIVEKTSTGYSAYAAKYALYTVGSGLWELNGNMIEALNLYFEDEGRTITEADIKVTSDHQHLV